MSSPSKPETAFGGTAGQQYPRMGINRNLNPIAEAVVEKMVAPQNISTQAARQRKEVRAPDMALMQKISDMTTNNVTSIEALMQMLPDTGLAMQILVSSILSPKDMVSTELHYSVDPGQFNAELSGALLECIRTHYDNTYKMGDQLPTYLQDALFYRGAYPMVILPENTIDDAINSPTRVSIESIKSQVDLDKGVVKSVGILGNPVASDNATRADALGLEHLQMSMENWRGGRAEYNPKVNPFTANGASGSFDPRLSITDNPNALKLPGLVAKMRSDRLQDLLSVQQLSNEAHDTVFNGRRDNNGAPVKSLYRDRRYKHTSVVAMRPSSTLKKKSVGNPLVLHMPVESVIPVHVPSNPKEHLGYFILLDQMGNPVVRANEADYYTNLSHNLNTQSTGIDALVARARRDTQGRDDPSMTRQQDIEELERVYGELVEAELKQRLATGVYGDNVEVAKPEQVYRIMLARALNKMQTQLLYVPAEMMVYIAFDYNQYGVGESLLGKSKIIAGLRSLMMFANTMAAMKNSVGRTNLNITLSEQDPDPQGTVEFMIHEHSKLRRGGFPLGNNDPNDLVSYIQNAGVEITVSGNAAYPETSLKVEDVQTSRVKPDQDLVDDLRKRHLMALGLSPETVDAGFGAEFATSVVANNLLLTKRVLMYQRILTSFLAEFIVKYTLASPSLMDELREIIKDNRSKLDEEDEETIQDGQKTADKKEAAQTAVSQTPGVIEERPLEANQDDPDDQDDEGVDQLITDFLYALQVTLPAPDTATLTNQIKAFDEYAEALDKALAVYLDSGFLTTTEFGELEEYIEPAIKATRAHYLRQWLRTNNVMPELDELTTFGEDSSPTLNMLETHGEHMKGIAESLLGYLKAIAASRKKLDPRTAEVKADLGGGEPAANDEFGSGTTDDGMGGDTTTDDTTTDTTDDSLADDLVDDTATDDATDTDDADTATDDDAATDTPAEGEEGAEPKKDDEDDATPTV